MSANCHYPRLFVKRVALYKSFSIGDLIREIPFERGLNLIIGEDAQEGLHNLGGHSVGKTTLCRLIRHCLGESTFASEDDQQAIRDNFPSGWVGCELDIDATPWAVLIPFIRTSKNVPLAARHETLVSLFDFEKSDNQYRQYMEALDALRPPQTAFTWVQLLAWLTRDQEAIQGNYWEWRSSNSESGTALPKNYDSRALLVRAVMGLKSAEEDDLLQEITCIEHQISIHDSQKKAYEQNLQSRVQHALEVLRQHVTFALPEPNKNAQLPALLMTPFFESIEKDIQQASIAHQEVRKAILHNKSTEAWLNEKIEEIQSVLSQKHQAVTFRTPDDDRQEYSAGKEFLDSIKEPMTCIARILVTDCKRVQELRDTYEKLLSKRQGKVLQFKTVAEENKFKDNRRIVEGIERDCDLKKKELEIVKRELEFLTPKEKELYDSYTALCRKLEILKEHWGTLESVWNTLCGGVPDEATLDTEHTLKVLHEEKADKEFLISRLRSELGNKLERLEQYFDEIVKKAIDDSCRGTIVPDGDKLNFSIKSNEKLLRKGAINISSTISGDIACMLSAATAENYHPGFIIHDSPRNYELNPQIYFNMLDYIVQIASGYQNGDIPFQYIASMTSNIAAEWKQFVRVRLASDPAEKLLFMDQLLPKQQTMM